MARTLSAIDHGKSDTDMVSGTMYARLNECGQIRTQAHHCLDKAAEALLYCRRFPFKIGR